jgi:hypothetical protein
MMLSFYHRIATHAGGVQQQRAHSGCHAYTTRRHPVLWVLVPSVVQSPAPSPVAPLPHAGGSVPAPINKEKVIAMMGGAAPQAPRDLTLLFSRMDGFGFSGLRSCRTLEKLDRRTGQRRDATRAPNQVRNGWRPSGLLITPPHHLSDGQILSNLWGPPQQSAHCIRHWHAPGSVGRP